MTHHIFNWKDKKGRGIFGQNWVPDLPPQAILCHIHGQSDHSSRFEHVADYMCKHNFAFFAIDLPGHGKSDGTRGHVNKFYEYIECVELLIDEAKKIWPGVPIFVYGHSMGGSVAINHAFYTTEKIAGYIITSPWIRLAFEPPAWKVNLGKTVKTIYPALLQPTGLDAKLISRDDDVVKKYVADKLVHGKISAAGFFEILTNGKNILLNADKLNYPMLLMHGTADGLTDYKSSREFAALRPDIITYVEFENFFHEMHNEPEKEKVFETIVSWIAKQLKK